MSGLIRDLSEDALRDAGAMKWAATSPGVLPAWVAEMDFGVAEPIQTAVMDYAAGGIFGYADPRGRERVAESLACFSQRHWGHQVDRERVSLVGDVMEGLALTLRHLTPTGPVIIPTPVYPPFLILARDLGREVRPVPLIRDGQGKLTLDTGAIQAQAQAGARTLLLCHPHNPVGRCYTAAELQQISRIADDFGVHVISDEIHAPLTLPGTKFTPYAALASAEAPVTTLISATKSFTMPGLRCAQLISHRAEDHATIAALPPVLNHAMTTLGQRASIAAFEHGDAWLRAICERFAANHHAFAARLMRGLPQVRIEVAEATYLAWLDVRELNLADPAASALAHGVRVDGQQSGYGPGGVGRIRINLGTSPQRVELIADRLIEAWTRER
ncbi:MAG: aminotransferase class I/II-fold pyridoxal phosphate-dependent enzyme [Ornithinimicrobium sp.]